MGYFTTPVVLDIDTPEGNKKTITIVPDYVESEKRFTGAYEILEEDISHGYIAFDDAHDHWEHSDMDLPYSEIVQLAAFIKDHEDADLDGVGILMAILRFATPYRGNPINWRHTIV